jgi:hypothetical protein
MAPRTTKKNTAQASTDDLSELSEESRTIVEYLTNLMTSKLELAVSEIVRKIEEKDVIIGQLESQVEVLKVEVSTLTERLEDVEAQSRSDSIIISGSALPECKAGENSFSVTANIIKNSLNYNLPPNMVGTAYRLGRKTLSQSPDKRNILVKLNNKDIRNDILRAARTVKPNNLFFSESLIPSRATIFRALRQSRVRYPDKIAAVGSSDGRVYIWLKLPDANARNKKVYINSMSQLEHFCEKSLGVGAFELINPTQRA